MMHVSEIVMNIACMECSNLSSVGGFFFIGRFVCCMTQEEKLSIQ